LAVMWVVAAFWAWDKPKRNTGLTMLFLGLGISVHIIVAAIAFSGRWLSGKAVGNGCDMFP